jgi:hypothetical protein
MQKRDIRKVIRYGLILLILILLPLVFESVRRILIVLILISVNFTFSFIKRFIPKLAVSNVIKGFELVLFSTIVSSYAYGGFIAALVGGVGILASYIGERRFSPYFIITVPLYMLIGFVTSYFIAINIVSFGIVITLCYNVLSVLLSKYMGAKLESVGVFAVTNIVFNAFLFLNFSRPVLDFIR